MNLIEQLGGYTKARKTLEQVKARDHKYAQNFERPALEKALLEYRRQHNIFEVEDKVVFINQNMSSSIKTIKEILNDTHVSFNFHGFHVKLIRHTTDAEIKAGRRLQRLTQSVVRNGCTFYLSIVK